jgi:aminopeptidase N
MRRRRRLVIGLIACGVAITACASTSPGLSQGTSVGITTAPDPTDPPTASTAAAATTTDPETTDPDSTEADTTDPDSTSPEETDPETSGADTTLDTNADVSGVGDVLYPDLGNPGLDVEHYDVDITYDHQTAVIKGDVTLTITATADLRAFTLDAVGLDVAAVTVDGKDASFDNDDPELRITPADAIADGDDFTVEVQYSAKGIDGTISAGVTAGWFETDEGSFVLNEPDGARGWLPSNDHPSDKATYHFTIHVPKGVTAAANGRLVDHTTNGDGEQWEWDQTDPQTTYVIQLLTGRLEIVEGAGPHDLPLVSVLQAGTKDHMQPYLEDTAKQIEFFEQFFGPYPFTSYGLAMTDGYIGGAMEEQGRSLFSQQDFTSTSLDGSTELLLSHELTHQWFGDAVSPKQWQNVWLNESFATYGEWMWLDHAGYRSVEQSARDGLAERQHSEGSTGEPDIPGLFGYEVYEGGATVLHALRKTVGDDDFFAILRSWTQDNRFESRATEDFIALAEKVSGKDLGRFFEDWLYAVDLPPEFPS